MARLSPILLTLATGIMLSLQARINAFLASDLGNQLGAGALVFFIGLTTTLVFTALAPAARRSVATMWGMLRRRELPWHLLASGPLGIIVIQAQIATVPVIGVALFAMSFIVGQMSAGTMIDHFGWSLGTRRRLNRLGAAALLLAVAGVVVSSAPRLGASGAGIWLACAFVFVAGATVGVQMAFNGSITAAVGRPEPAGVATYALGSLAYLAVLGASSVSDGGASFASYAHIQWWYPALGIIGPAVVLIGAVLVRRVGVLLFAIGVVAGQLAGSMILDLVWPTASGTPSWLTVLGAVMALVALVCLQRWGQRTEPTLSEPSAAPSAVP
ncbi:DMT family transporter [Sinomonas sp. P10A9]|uniref:DMT family transporter n=1 Tax=Sinomonas puerhi TaxID=3238584 RepID=A0AB39L7B2_9MICC